MVLLSAMACAQVVFGHDADRGLQQYDRALGIDTG
jgi:hypothetical protein